jgi:hypothetical protein
MLLLLYWQEKTRPPESHKRVGSGNLAKAVPSCHYGLTAPPGQASFAGEKPHAPHYDPAF